MPAMSANVRKAAERATLTLPFRVPPQDWFSIRDMARLSGMQKTFIEEVYDAGHDLSGHNYNSAGDEGKRMSKRIPRTWAVAYMIKTAAYTDESLADALIACLPNLPATTLLRVASAARNLAAEKGMR